MVVMDEHGHTTRENDVVRVEIGDGEVVDLGGLGPSLDAADPDPRAGAGAQELAGLKVDRVDPLAW